MFVPGMPRFSGVYPVFVKQPNGSVEADGELVRDLTENLVDRINVKGKLHNAKGSWTYKLPVADRLEKNGRQFLVLNDDLDWDSEWLKNFRNTRGIKKLRHPCLKTKSPEQLLSEAQGKVVINSKAGDCTMEMDSYQIRDAAGNPPQLTLHFDKSMVERDVFL